MYRLAQHQPVIGSRDGFRAAPRHLESEPAVERQAAFVIGLQEANSAGLVDGPR